MPEAVYYASESSHIVQQGYFSSITLLQLRVKMFTDCYFMYMLGYTKWEYYLTITKGAQGCLTKQVIVINALMPYCIQLLSIEGEKNVNDMSDLFSSNWVKDSVRHTRGSVFFYFAVSSFWFLSCLIRNSCHLFDVNPVVNQYHTTMTRKVLYLSRLKAMDSFGILSKTSFLTRWIATCAKNNKLWKFWLNWSLRLQENHDRKTTFSHKLMCFQMPI